MYLICEKKLAQKNEQNKNKQYLNSCLGAGAQQKIIKNHLTEGFCLQQKKTKVYCEKTRDKFKP